MKSLLTGILLGIAVGVVGTWRMFGDKQQGWLAERRAFLQQEAAQDKVRGQLVALVGRIAFERDTGRITLFKVLAAYEVQRDSTKQLIARANVRFGDGPGAVTDLATCKREARELAASCEATIARADTALAKEKNDRGRSDQMVTYFRGLYESYLASYTDALGLVRTAPVGEKRFFGIFGPVRKTVGAGCTYGVSVVRLIKDKQKQDDLVCGATFGLSVSF